MKKIKLILLASALFCLSHINAQSVNIRLDSNLLATIDTVHLGQVDSLNLRLYNDSSVRFIGIITIASNINFSFSYTGDSSTDPIYYPYSQVIDTIPPGGSVLRSLIVTVNNPPFIVGTSGVVIWPKVTSQTFPLLTPAIISDTIRKLITVLYPVGIDEITDRNLKVYMDNQELVIQGDDRYPLKNVELYDAEGRLLQEQQISVSGNINLARYASGVYFARVIFEDNTRATFKVLNTR